MFSINANPTIDATLTIAGQGREQKLKVTFRHKTRTEYGDMLKSIADGKLESTDALAEIIESWDADAEPTAATFKRLQDQQPGADWAILTGYGDALTVARKGN